TSLIRQNYFISYSNASFSEINLGEIYNNLKSVEVYNIKGKKIKLIDSPPFLLSINDNLSLGFYILKIIQNDNKVIYANLSVLK
ncbi:MAG: T9SS type A sorting domain-containing protein, partial [candidate division WOR-3 bacterium]